MATVRQKYDITRRQFVAGAAGVLSGIVAALIGIPGIGYLISPALERRDADEWVPLGPLEAIPEGEPTLYSFTRTSQIGWERTATSYGAYVLRAPGDEIEVFSNVCTHLSCRVTWQEDRDIYVCPCHDGHFARDGEIISGPQPRPLDRFEHKIEEGTLWIHLVEA